MTSITNLPPSYINSLPNELLGEIFSHLDTKGIGKCTQVQSNWYKIGIDVLTSTYQAKSTQELFDQIHIFAKQIKFGQNGKIVCKLPDGDKIITIHIKCTEKQISNYTFTQEKLNTDLNLIKSISTVKDFAISPAIVCKSRYSPPFFGNGIRTWYKTNGSIHFSQGSFAYSIKHPDGEPDSVLKTAIRLMLDDRISVLADLSSCILMVSTLKKIVLFAAIILGGYCINASMEKTCLAVSAVAVLIFWYLHSSLKESKDLLSL